MVQAAALAVVQEVTQIQQHQLNLEAVPSLRRVTNQQAVISQLREAESPDLVVDQTQIAGSPLPLLINLMAAGQRKPIAEKMLVVRVTNRSQSETIYSK